MRVVCDECGRVYRVHPDREGHSFTCGKCGEWLIVPTRREPPQERPSRRRREPNRLPPRQASRRKKPRQSRDFEEEALHAKEQPRSFNELALLIFTTILVGGAGLFFLVMSILLIVDGKAHFLAVLGFWMLAIAVAWVYNLVWCEDPELGQLFRFAWPVIPVYSLIRLDRYPIQAVMSVVGGLMLAYGAMNPPGEASATSSSDSPPPNKPVSTSQADSSSGTRNNVAPPPPRKLSPKEALAKANQDRETVWDIRRYPICSAVEWSLSVEAAPSGPDVAAVIAVNKGHHRLVVSNLEKNSSVRYNQPVDMLDLEAAGYLPDGRIYRVGNGRLTLFRKHIPESSLVFSPEHQKADRLAQWSASVSPDPDRPVLVVAVDDTIWIMDWEANRVIRTLPRIFSSRDKLLDIQVSQDASRLLAVGSRDSVVFSLPQGMKQIPQLRTGSKAGTFVPGGGFLIGNIGFNSTGGRIVTFQSEDSSVRKLVVADYAVTPDGRVIGCSDVPDGPLWDFGVPSSWTSKSRAKVLHRVRSDGIDYLEDLKALVLLERSDKGPHLLVLIPWPPPTENPLKEN